MTVPIDIEFPLGDQLAAILRDREDAARDLTPAMKEIAEHLQSDTILRFEEEEDPSGHFWIPSQRVLARPGEKTLNKDGHLKSSIDADWSAEHAAAGVVASGPAIAYAAIHQFGGPITPRGARGQAFAARYFMPARAYLGFTDFNRAFALDVLGDHLAPDESAVQ